MSNDDRINLAGMPAEQAVDYAMNNDLGKVLQGAEVVRERRPAKMVTALRIDLDLQAELEEAARARGVGTSTLMRQIIEEWVQANRTRPPQDSVSELVRHLDAARRVADALTQQRVA